MSFTFGAPAAGAPAATSGSSLFGTSTPASSSAPLFGTVPAASTTATSLFGTQTAAPTSASKSLFGAPTATPSSTAPLFGTSSATTTTSSLFGSTVTTAAAASGAAPFGALATATTTAPSLFGTPAPATTSTAGSLFGKPAVTTTTTGGLLGSLGAGGTGLFGPSTTTAQPATSTSGSGITGLGGTAQASSTLTGATTGVSSVLGKTTVEKENVRDGEVPKVFMDLLASIKNKISENKRMSDQFSAASSEDVLRIKERLKEVKHLTHDCTSKSSELDQTCSQLSTRVVRDVRLGKEAVSAQETRGSSTTQQHTMQHIMDLIREYDAMISSYQEVVEQLTLRFRQIMEGHMSLSTASLQEYLKRFELMFDAVATKLFEANGKVEELRRMLMIDGSFVMKDTGVKKQSEPGSWTTARGESAFPSHATLMSVASLIKPAQPTAATATATTSLFGGATGGSSLFGSTAAPKPLFGTVNTGSTTTSLFPTATTTTASQTTSLFSSTTSKPATSTFGTTLSTNTTGLLFTGKK